MESMPPLVCPRCGEQAVTGLPYGSGCPRCLIGGVAVNLRTVYDLAEAGGRFRDDLQEPTLGTARYRALLPAQPEDGSAGAAPTPLLPAPRLAGAIGLEKLWIKDESRGLTWSFKDRAASVAAAHAAASGARVMVAASTGNAAAATAAHARRWGLTPVLLVASEIDPLMASFVTGYGACVIDAGSKADRWQLMGEAVRELGWYPMSNWSDPPIGNNPYAVDGYKPIAYEIWEQLGRRAPDAVYFPVCYGDALSASHTAFGELVALGLATKVPAHSGGEVHGTLGAALAAGTDRVPRAEQARRTRATSIAATQSTYQALHAVRTSGGSMHTVGEDELDRAVRLAASTEGVLLEDAAAAGLAALTRHAHDGVLDRRSSVVLIASSSGLKSLGHRMDALQPLLRARDVQDLERLVSGARATTTGRAS